MKRAVELGLVGLAFLNLGAAYVCVKHALPHPSRNDVSTAVFFVSQAASLALAWRWRPWRGSPRRLTIPPRYMQKLAGLFLMLLVLLDVLGAALVVVVAAHEWLVALFFAGDGLALVIGWRWRPWKHHDVVSQVNWWW